MKTRVSWIRAALLLVVLWAMPQPAAGYYDPGVQRWINRDPIGEIGGKNLYSFYRNDLINRHDRFGLCPKSCEEVCDEVNKELHPPGGMVVCRGGRPCPCYTPGTDQPKKGECPDFEKIVMDHERSHLPNVTCEGNDPNKNTVPKSKPGVDDDFEECRARVQTIFDLRNAIPNASGKCKEAMEKLEAQLMTWVMANCD